MAQPTLPAETIAQIRAVFAECGNKAETARRVGCARGTVDRWCRVQPATGPQPCGPRVRLVPIPDAAPPPTLPAPAPEAGGPTLPSPVSQSYDPLRIDTPGAWLVLSDLQMPYHDTRAIEAAVADGRARNVAGVLVNGDALDCASISHHYREPDVPRLQDELETGERFFLWLRAKFPAARIIFKAGNHEERIPRYLASAAPELVNLKALSIPELLHLDRYGVEWVTDKRLVYLGRLPVVHGHEFGGGAGGVNPARWLFLRTLSTALCGHFHRASQHDEAAIDGRLHGTWSTGCLCYLHPKWLPINKWSHGWAVVEIHAANHFAVTNRRMLPDGRIV